MLKTQRFFSRATPLPQADTDDSDDLGGLAQVGVPGH
jgi:hypothetical protein